MFSNLKININNFKKKIIYTTAVLVMNSAILGGCSVITDNNTKTETNESVEDTSRLDITVNFNDYNYLSEKDLIVFYDGEGNIFNDTYSDEETKNVTIYPKDLDNIKVSSAILNTVIDLPAINDTETFDITFDYTTKTYDVEIIEKALDNGKTL